MGAKAVYLALGRECRPGEAQTRTDGCREVEAARQRAPRQTAARSGVSSERITDCWSVTSMQNEQATGT